MTSKRSRSAPKKRGKSAQSAETLPVIIRFEGRGSPRKKDWHRHDLVAFFPTENGTSSPYSMLCYSPLGEHASAQMDYLRATKPATPEQVKAMLSILRGRGYEHLRVIKRQNSAHLDIRKEKLRR